MFVLIAPEFYLIPAFFNFNDNALGIYFRLYLFSPSMLVGGLTGVYILTVFHMRCLLSFEAAVDVALYLY